MWKKILCLLLALLMLLSCAACGSKTPDPPQNENNENSENQEVTPEPLPPENTEPDDNTENAENAENTEPDPEPTAINYLTGEPLEDPALVTRRPVAVMLNDIHVAMPQHGQSEADMIFEYNVEGGITRMVAFYLDPSKVGTIGSVRSARACFVETVYGMDAIYVHAGGSPEAVQMISSYGITDLNEGCSIFWRDSERRKTMAYEHTLMTSGENIANYLEKTGKRTELRDGFSYPVTFVEDATPVNGETAARVEAVFSNYKSTTFTYDEASGLYRIGQFNKAYVDGNTGEQVTTTNVLVLRTSVVNSGDDKGRMNIDLRGSGQGVFFCGGKAEPITWAKEGPKSPFTYYHADGTPLSLQVGHTYVCVIAKSATLSYGS